jgi:uncharacterized protein (DUF1330 family)
MVAYVIGEVEVTDPEGYEPYKPLAEASILAHGGVYRVRGGQTESLEGEAPRGRVVVLEFPDVDTARRWYRSAAYQAALPLRQAASNGRLFLVEGCPPGCRGRAMRIGPPREARPGLDARDARVRTAPSPKPDRRIHRSLT